MAAGRGRPELIDTLWNVNKCGRKIRVYEEYELIDTLWNVNVNTYHVSA